MKTLEQIQQENRKMILEAIHGCSYEEALEKELGFGCEVYLTRLRAKDLKVKHKVIIITITKQTIECLKDGEVWLLDREFEDIEIEILGKPLTLDRVLLAICQRGYYDDIDFNEENKTIDFDYRNLDLSLIKPTLEEHSEETQRAFHKFMGGEND